MLQINLCKNFLIRRKKEIAAKRAKEFAQTEKGKASLKKHSKNHHARRREILQKIKLEKGCIDCGYKENVIALDFDHIDPSTKLFDPSKGVKLSLESMLAEIAKCEVRCSNCHRIKNFIVRLDKIVENIEKIDVFNDANNIGLFKTKSANSDYRRKRKKLNVIQQLKLKKGCIDCGYNKHPEALDFDHIDPSIKSLNVARMSTRKWDSILQEIEKCVVRCSNCHRIKTYKDSLNKKST